MASGACAFLVEAAIAVQARDGAEPGAQLGGVEGLAEEVVGPGLQPAQLGGAVVEGGEHDHRHGGERGLGAQLRADFVAVHAGHHDVEEDDVGPGLRGGERGGTVLGAEDAVALRLQEHVEEVPGLGFVVDDEDGGSGGGVHGTEAGSAGRARWAGVKRAMVRPSSRRLIGLVR